MSEAKMPEHAALTGFDDRTVFRTLFAAYPDALLLVDAQGVIALANAAASALLGYAIDELVGLPVDALVPDSIRPRHAAYREAYARAPRARPMGTTQSELVARHRDGSEVLVEIALSPLQQHGLPYVVAAVRGVAAYPRVQQALRRARYAEQVALLGRVAVDTRDPQQLLARVPQVAADALQVPNCTVWLLEPNRIELRVAGGVGLLRGERIGDPLPRAGTLPGLALDTARPVSVAEHAADARFEVPRAVLDAGLQSALAVPLSDRGSMVGALLVRARERQRFGDDEQRFVESLASLLASSLQRAHTEEQLAHAQRLESVGQLTGGIAHDFNNLLTVISGNLQVLEDLPSVQGDAVAPQMLAAATRATRRAAELTGKLLAFSRRQVLKPSRVDVVALLRSLADMLRRTLDQRIEIRLDAPADCPPCIADTGQLESALLNIAINARDAMPDGGTFSFACRALAAAPAELRDELPDPRAGYVAIAIADSGSGMPEAVRERAFEPFFTTKEAGRGTGLGLSTVYGFAKQSNGAVTLASEVGNGTTVTLYLPQPSARADDAGTDTDARGRVPPGLRVLLVEDDAEVRAVVQRFLVALGCVVRSCVNAEQALDELASDPSFDLLFSDVALGAGMRGSELARLARQRLPQLPLLLMTGFASEPVEMPHGAELLRKPFGRAELAAAIGRVVGR